MKNKIFAFTLIELSFVIIIVGILIAGVMTASSLVKKSKIVAAQTLTRSSPINGIKDIALWIESSAESSFKENESSNGDAISTWYDKKNYLNKSSILSVGTGPTYSNTINDIPAVKFSGSNANYLQIADASFLNNANYTIVVLEKRQSATAGYFIGDNAVVTANQTLLLGYSADAVISHSQGDNNIYNSNISTYSSSIDAPRIFTFVFDSTNGKKTYINGILAGENSNTNKLNNITTLAIGKGYTGEIGEIAIFTRALKLEERKSIEDYLGKKFSIKINRGSAANGSCMNGIVTTNGCDMSLANCSISQAGVSTTVVSPAANPTTLSCNVNHYSGTVSYTCINGTPSVSGSCGCATGYTGVGCSACDTNYESDGNGNCSSVECTVAGGVTTDSNTVAGSTIHKFTGSGTINCPTARSVQYLIVGGGGGGGYDGGGGGGGGGFKTGDISISASTDYSIVVGLGGSESDGSAGYQGYNGGDSSFNGIISLGGGGGGAKMAAGKSGGSGGGSGHDSENVISGGSGASGQGYAGGQNGTSGGGGGGGAGGVGTSGSAGNGGNGATSSITGTSVYYGGGGGGGSHDGMGTGNAGLGGGGLGGVGGAPPWGKLSSAGTNGLGGGGGGAGNAGDNQAKPGGSGVVIIRY